jgi:hypothetical protein
MISTQQVVIEIQMLQFKIYLETAFLLSWYESELRHSEAVFIRKYQHLIVITTSANKLYYFTYRELKPTLIGGQMQKNDERML